MSQQTQTPIAIVGIGGIFPGAADPDEYWRLIVNRVEMTADVPSGRWIAAPDEVCRSQHQPDSAISRRACLVDDRIMTALEDRIGRLPIDPDLLRELDPMYRLVLAAGQMAFDGSRSGGIPGERFGVILAAIALPTDNASRLAWDLFSADFKRRLSNTSSQQAPPISRERALGARVTAFPAVLLAKSLGLRACAYTLDAACASSLYAVKLACDALRAGRADAMLAGGVSRPDCLYTQIGFSQLRALSASGRCSPFDRSADGLVVGEGAGLVVLKRLPDALRDGDEIHALIRGVGLSNDMDGNLLAPDPEGQLRAMRQAYGEAGWSPDDVDLIECHGAGTPAGDTAEIRSLERLWEGVAARPGQCPIGSVKSMIGHLLTAAGAAGLIKILLAMRHAILPPSLNFTEAPEKSHLRGSPFYVQTEAQDWQRRSADTPRRAAVSAFGFGGINAHLLLEQWAATPVPAESLSAEAVSIGGTPLKTEVAVVGMASAFGPLSGTTDFLSAVRQANSALVRRPAERFCGADSSVAELLGSRAGWGGFMDAIDIDAAQFHIPPKEIPDILPQHLLMLKVARRAMSDAGMDLREMRPRMGAVIGMGFDHEATDYHLRWHLSQVVADWARELGLELDADRRSRWLETLRDAWGPPLTSARTLGALGGIIANRIGREFRFGGPTFVVSEEAASCIRALDIAMGSLQNGETDAFLVGAVDMAGDLRAVAIADALNPFSSASALRPFSIAGEGTLPGDGAGAFVLKRLEDARRDGDRIYAVIHAVSGAGPGPDLEESLLRSLQHACDAARIPIDGIGYIEAHASGTPNEDQAEFKALTHNFAVLESGIGLRVPVGAVKRIIGHCGAAAAAASLVLTAAALFQGKIPKGATDLDDAQMDGKRREAAQAWPLDSDGRKRPAAVAAITPDGCCSHVILTAADCDSTARSQAQKTSPVISHAGIEGQSPKPRLPVRVVVGGSPPTPTLPPGLRQRNRDATPLPAADRRIESQAPLAACGDGSRQGHLFADVLQDIGRNAAATAKAHRHFLALSDDLLRGVADTVAAQARMLAAARRIGRDAAPKDAADPGPSPLFSRDMCLEFAVGSAARVLGPEFAEIDTFRARVRLPGEPLMLVDRILKVEGRKGALGSGRVITEHDVRPNAWYLDGGRAPVCISVEAGQADLFLCAYLGIDLQVRGRRTYRLLDATVRFHRGLPQPGDVVRYDIRIDRFVRQGNTWLFFFRFEGTIRGEPLISMTDGCAGFFTPQEVEASGGILLTDADTRPQPGRRSENWRDLVPQQRESYDSRALDALRRGNAAECFGNQFDGVLLPPALRLPGGRMKLIDRIVELDPIGGRYGIGVIRAETDIHPDDWFLTCHFVDDMVMPGTLMYECCAHTLRVFLLRLGWVTDRDTVAYEPVVGVRSVLKCRGPVTPQTRKVRYEVQVKDIGYGPEPYVIADAHMFADGRRIVFFRDLSMRMTGLDQKSVEDFWRRQRKSDGIKSPLFERTDLEEFALGAPSKVFGPAFAAFDRGRFIARLPAPPFLLISRIVASEAPPNVLAPGGWIETEVDLSPDDWYFRAGRTGFLPISILMEIALQPCGWLAAYAGSSLSSDQDLKFRNLGGTARLHAEIPAADSRLKVRARMTQVSEAADMILEAFEFKVSRGDEPVYDGTAHFGFFTPAALERQVGIRESELPAWNGMKEAPSEERSIRFERHRPLTPEDPHPGVEAADAGGLRLPSGALQMVETVDLYRSEGGPSGLGIVRGSQMVDPDAWFFKAHFYQDPVWPGSLGIESFLQLIKFVARERWPERRADHRFALASGAAHTWRYRGQIVPRNKKVTVTAAITATTESPLAAVTADGWLAVDDRVIYKMENFGLQLVPLAG